VTAGGSGASRIVSDGDSLEIKVKASCISAENADGMASGTISTSNGTVVAVKLYQYQSGSRTATETSTSSGTYTPVSIGTVFTDAVSTVPANASGIDWKPVIREGAAPGTYRLEFTIGDKVEYLDFIVQ
jgi:hypothetical protein